MQEKLNLHLTRTPEHNSANPEPYEKKVKIKLASSSVHFLVSINSRY